jgi:predicted acyl esterase
MPDGVRLLTDFYFPDGTGPWPVVLIRTPYNRSSYYNFQMFVDNGYAVVVQSCRGRGGSEGFFWMFEDDRSDGHATIEWIAQQTWCNGNIGMIGLSALALTQYVVMHNAPPELKCLAPERTVADWYHHAYFQGGAYRYELMEGLCNYFGIPAWCDMVLLEHRLHDEWWEQRDLLVHPDAVHVPMLHIGGWYDFSQQSDLDTFAYFQHNGGAAGNQFLIMDPLDHHYAFGQLPFPPQRFPRGDGYYYHQHLLAWMDHWLKGEPSGVDQWPSVHVYLMGACEEPGAPGCHWVDLDDWPPPHRAEVLYLSADGTLTPSVPDAGELELEISPFDPVETLGGANSSNPRGPYDQMPRELRDDVLVFTTDELQAPLHVMGQITARIWIRPDSPDLDLSVRLTDVYPDGRSMLIIDGIKRARMRDGYDHELFLDIGVPTEIEVDLWSTAMVFNTGHRIRVAIAGTNWDRFEINDNSGGDLNDPQYQVARPAILFGPDYPSSIELPIPVVFTDSFESGDTSAWSATVP